MEARLSALEEQGKTVILLADAQGVYGLFAVADTVKEHSREAIADLHTLQIKTLMLTGDNAHTARAIAAQVGIDEAHGDLLPEDKLKVIEKNSQAAALSAWLVMASMMSGTRTRRHRFCRSGRGLYGHGEETADVALMDDDLRKLPRFIRLSRDTHALASKTSHWPWASRPCFHPDLDGTGTMWMAVFADVGTALCCCEWTQICFAQRHEAPHKIIPTMNDHFTTTQPLRVKFTFSGSCGRVFASQLTFRRTTALLRYLPQSRCDTERLWVDCRQE